MAYEIDFINGTAEVPEKAYRHLREKCDMQKTDAKKQQLCPVCQTPIYLRTGACHVCTTCGTSQGCS